MAGQPLKLTFDNKQAGVPHNVGIYDSPAKAKEIFEGDNIIGPATMVYNVPALTAGHVLLPVRRAPEHERDAHREVRSGRRPR